jgi:hypothetical protein
MIIGVIQGSDDPFKRERLLRQIGVDEQILQTALDAGDSAALRCTANHPKMMPGMYRFGETVASLGAQLWGKVGRVRTTKVSRPCSAQTA